MTDDDLVAPATQSVNVKIDFTITDQRGGAPPIKRTVSAIVSDGNRGQVRSTVSVLDGNVTNVPLNVDTVPRLLPDGKIKLEFTLSYDWPVPPATQTEPSSGPRIVRTNLVDSVTLILTSGQAITAAQSADPVGDRQVTVEVKATILK